MPDPRKTRTSAALQIAAAQAAYEAEQYDREQAEYRAGPDCDNPLVPVMQRCGRADLPGVGGGPQVVPNTPAPTPDDED